LFFMYRKKYKALFYAVLVQLVGVLGISGLTGSSPIKIVHENIRLFFRLFDQPGVHLSRWFEFISDNHFVSVVPALVMTALVFIPLLFWTQHRPEKRLSTGQQEVIDFHVLTILFIWVILVAYHRLYDTLILLSFIVLVFKGLAAPNIWKLTRFGRIALLTFMGILPFFLILPARIVDRFLPEYYGTISDAVTTIILLIMLAVSMFLLQRYLNTMQFDRVQKETESHELRNDPQRDTQPGWAHHAQSPTGTKRS
jgi:hypothetical protein